MTKTAKKAVKSADTKPAATIKRDAASAVAAGAANASGEDDPPLPVMSRLVIIVLTSYVAEKIWRYRSVVSAGWYSDKQSPVEQSMIVAFEFTIAMGLLFFLGILISVGTVTVQKKVFGV